MYAYCQCRHHKLCRAMRTRCLVSFRKPHRRSGTCPTPPVVVGPAERLRIDDESWLIATLNRAVTLAHFVYSDRYEAFPILGTTRFEPSYSRRRRCRSRTPRNLSLPEPL